MKHKLLYALGAVVLAVVALGAVANGPYYALPAWSQKLVCAVGNCPRFIVLLDWNSEAVLDRETGLVWERSPSTTTRTWLNAQIHCNPKTVGNRKGWRLPTIQELASLIDPSVAFPGPTLPAGHPFSNVQQSFNNYWSATTVASLTGFAWAVNFSGGNLALFDDKNISRVVWCVRGGQGVDPQ
jgi:hypothetical protein